LAHNLHEHLTSSKPRHPHEWWGVGTRPTADTLSIRPLSPAPAPAYVPLSFELNFSGLPPLSIRGMCQQATIKRLMAISLYGLISVIQ